jgi:hypothetical protein
VNYHVQLAPGLDGGGVAEQFAGLAAGIAEASGLAAAEIDAGHPAIVAVDCAGEPGDAGPGWHCHSALSLTVIGSHSSQ